jgi:hypothetical protein
MFKVTHHPPPENRFRKHKEKEKKIRNLNIGNTQFAKELRKGFQDTRLI